MPAIDLNLGFYQVAKHYYFPGWHQQSTLFDLMISKAKWDGLSDVQKAQLEVACGDMVRQILARGESMQSPAMLRMRDKHDVKVMYWPQEFLDAYETAWQEVIVEESENNANFKKIYASYSKFREEFRLWGENGYLKR